ncbi:MAG: mannitol dehydrogenase family protein, partial [Sphingomonadales bacterium]
MSSSSLPSAENMTAIRLNRSNLDRLLTLATPSYDLSGLGTSIVHLGLGGFHRAHMARYTHDLMTKDPQALPWGIVGAGLLESDSAILSDLSKQDRLYTLTERSGGAETISVVGALAGLIDASQRTAALLDAIDRAWIVSLTVTEHGYCLDRATKQLSFALPIIEQDLATPEAPRSVPGIIVEAYRRRMAAGAPAFTALSCDNIQHNGDLLRGAVLALAARRDPLLAAWIEAHGRFPNTMVDRITPLTQHHDVAAVAAMGVADMRPVVAETFRQWVIEDDFADGRPAWESVGAQFVADVAPYELMKLRLLNATHLAIAAPARLIGHAYIDDAMRDPALRRYAEALMERETGPTLPAVPGIDLAQY